MLMRKVVSLWYGSWIEVRQRGIWGREKSKVFTGKSKIDQHKLVYKALKGKMGNELHALALNTMEIK